MLSPDKYYSILQPLLGMRATLNTVWKKTGLAGPRPEFLKVSEPARAARRERADDYLNHILEFFPERLAEEKWMTRCRFEGLDQLPRARKNGPVILAFCHFGPYYLLRFWLRAAGIPAATLVRGKSAGRMRVMRLKDRLSPFHEIPAAFYQDQLREMGEFLAAGNVLLIAMDAPLGRQITLSFCDGWSFQIATGPVRLAGRHQAEIFPCSIIGDGRWRFRIQIGRPVPAELLAAEVGWPAAGQYLLDELMPAFRAHPEQCRADLTRCLIQKP